MYGLGGKAAAQTSRRGGMGEFLRGRRSLAEAFLQKEGRVGFFGGGGGGLGGLFFFFVGFGVLQPLTPPSA